MTPTENYYENTAKTVIANMKKRQINGYYCQTAAEAVELANDLIKDCKTAAFGGSMTLQESGMLDNLRNNPSLTLIDRAAAKTPEEAEKVYHDAFHCDAYFMSSNAVTVSGELVNIDGNGNRVAALIYGPKKVILLCGMNKVCSNVDEALLRVHNIATPQNCLRLNKQTPCAATGVCANCLSPDCICNQVVTTRRSGDPNRIHVILIGESLGY
ncbi:MAG: lactate utilization protein [Lachnospiraceae bacterium]